MTLEKIKQKLTSSDNYLSLHTPTYLADLNAFKTNLSDLLASFKKYYNHFNIGYSFKTNYYEGFLDIVRELGCMAEVVSPKEYDMAIANDFDDSQIIFNGMIPAIGQKLSVLYKGGIVNFDNIGDLVATVSKSKSGKPLEIGIRLNIDIGSGIQSRFGIKPYSDDYQLICELANRNLFKIKAIHCHLSYARSLDKFEKRMDRMLEVAQQLHPSIIDIGGNMFGRVDPLIEKQMIKEAGQVPTYDDYAKVIAGRMKEAYPNEEPLLLIECGTPIVGNCMYLLTTCISTKQYDGETPIAVLDCTRNDAGFVLAKKEAAIYPFDGNEKPLSKARIFGCSCIEDDILHHRYNGPMERGHKYIIANVGAYGMNVANDFIIKKPPVYPMR